MTLSYDISDVSHPDFSHFVNVRPFTDTSSLRLTSTRSHWENIWIKNLQTDRDSFQKWLITLIPICINYLIFWHLTYERITSLSSYVKTEQIFGCVLLLNQKAKRSKTLISLNIKIMIFIIRDNFKGTISWWNKNKKLRIIES